MGISLASGFFGAFLLMTATLWIFAAPILLNAAELGHLQILSSAFMAWSHGIDRPEGDGRHAHSHSPSPQADLPGFLRCLSGFDCSGRHNDGYQYPRRRLADHQDPREWV